MNNAGVFTREHWRRMQDINSTGAVIGTMMAVQRCSVGAAVELSMNLREDCEI